MINHVSRTAFGVCALLVFVFSCAAPKSNPQLPPESPTNIAPPSPSVAEQPAETAPEDEPLVLDPAHMQDSYEKAIRVTERERVSTAEETQIKSDIDNLVGSLNAIIARGDYETWRRYLDKRYLALISNPAFLAEIAAREQFRTHAIPIATTADYFKMVVEPSRRSIKIDDVDILTPTRAIVYTVKRGERLRVYDLSKDAEGWKIIN